MTIFVGIDWAEAHHDVCVLDREGAVLASRRIPDGLDGVALLHAVLADHAESPTEVIVGIETDRGLLVSALVGAGYQLFAINPRCGSRWTAQFTPLQGARPIGIPPSGVSIVHCGARPASVGQR